MKPVLPFTPGDVPCNGCTLCCYGDAVRLVPEHDDLSRYQLEANPHFPGQYMLAHKPNGECIYLTVTGCGIHKDRPFMCRTMDCRMLPLRIRDRATVARLYEQGRMRMDVWIRGAELLRAAIRKSN